MRAVDGVAVAVAAFDDDVVGLVLVESVVLPPASLSEKEDSVSVLLAVLMESRDKSTRPVDFLVGVCEEFESSWSLSSFIIL